MAGKASLMRPIFVFALIVSVGFISFAEERALYIVLMEGDPIAFHGGSRISSREDGRRLDQNRRDGEHKTCLIQFSFQYADVGVATLVGAYVLPLFTKFEAEKLKDAAGVKLVERDRGARLMTTYSPEFLGLLQGAWTLEGGDDRGTGEGIVIGFVDSGINPTHPSFAYDPLHPFTSSISHFSGA
ncbi:hypothetical protein C1H46_015635 [Malus baccata]|uniref:Inhibitor I9 domain-containing protein n=1 Tax=Malus baccata TaxID=106549 RepID=A0A540MIU2_MALBA|nr:hypothetical protein C1H46_015635 [Malus baccata]